MNQQNDPWVASGQQATPPPPPTPAQPYAAPGQAWNQTGPQTPPAYGYAYPPQPPTPLASSASRIPAWVALGGAVLVVLGSFMPWVNVPLLGAVSGTSGDGSITLVLGLIAAGLALVAGLGRAQTVMYLISAGVVLLATLIGIYDLVNVTNGINESSNEYFTALLGPGLPMIVVGGLVAICACIAGVVAVQKDKRSRLQR